MRNKLMILAIVAMIPVPALAGNPMTLEQLKAVIAEARSAHWTDAETVRKLADAELTGQLRAGDLAALELASPGVRTVQALRGLADASVFLDPPKSEVPSTAEPDYAAQAQMLGRTIHYVARVLPTLPDFMASRVTHHYDDSPVALEPGGWPLRAGLHLDSSSEIPVSYIDGEERIEGAPPPPAAVATLKKTSTSKQPEGPKYARSESGLNSWGEFRTILGIILVDAAKGKVSWARWERIDGKSAAVFQFQISRAASHYEVQFSRNRPAKANTKTLARYVFRQTSGYHGQLAVDPETGTVLRAVVEADPEPGSPIQRASMIVEYQTTMIGGRSFVCPVRSISVSTSDEIFQATPQNPFEDLVEMQINETSFTGYRRFGSEATLIAGPTTEVAAGSATASGAAVAGVAAGTAKAGEGAAGATPAAAEVAAAEPTAAAPSETISAAEEKADEEILIKAVESMPGESGENEDGSDEPAESLTLKNTTRLVDIGLVVLDKHGKPVTDLKQEDIEIYDNGRKQQLSSFHHNAAPGAAADQPSRPAAPSDTFTNAVTVTREVQDAPDLLILLLDESHLAFQDLNRARGELLRFLQATRSTSRIALYSVNEHGFHVIQDVTQDHALVLKKLTTWMPNASSVSQAQALDTRIRQQFDTVHNVTDLNSVNGNYTEVADGFQPVDPELRQMGQNPLRAMLEGLVALSRHFAPVAGHKSMAWITGDSALADWTDQAVGTEKGSNQMGAAIQRTKESLNEAHIALYAVDASAVAGDAVDPSLEFRNVELNQAAKDNTALYSPPQGRNSTAGRVQAQMEQDLHGIQGPVRQLAESTGGRAINKGGDLAATMAGIEQDSNSLYEVGFDPDTAADGQFHTLLVKTPNRKDLKLRYRTGYLYAEVSKTTKQRFQQAIWSPQDSGELALTAQAVPGADATGDSSVKLHISFPGLALHEKAGRWTDELYVFIAQRDDATQKAEVSGDTMRLSLKQATYETGMPAGIPYERMVAIKSKLGSVRVIVVDANSGRMGSVTLPASALHP